MGIRMHLGVGYGLRLDGLNTSMIEKPDQLEDEISFSAFHAAALASATERGDLSDKMALHYASQNTNLKAFYQTIDYDSEFGFEDRMLLYPLGYKETWHRYADLLDIFLYEASKPNGDLENEWLEKPGTLYPFVGLMKANSEKPLGVEEFWEPCYLDKPEFADAIAKAPMHLWHLIRHLGLTNTDEDTTKAFLSLRPTIMRWWS